MDPTGGGRASQKPGQPAAGNGQPRVRASWDRIEAYLPLEAEPPELRGGRTWLSTILWVLTLLALVFLL